MKTASLVFAFAILGFAACSSSTTPDSVPADASSGEDGSKTKSDASKTGNGDEKDAAPATDDCSAETSAQGCLQCCAGQHESGFAIYQQTVVACVCKDDNCATECGDTLCAAKPKNADEACSACVQEKQNNCQQDLQDKCGADQDCVDFNNCAVDAKCDVKQ